MKFGLVLLIQLVAVTNVFSQAPKALTASQIRLNIKKLHVLGSVLYIAAHPDDENTRLIAYMANDKLYRTGYLSLTRGDGGQNLIGGEQGIELGLIRTQELLAARRIDGGEQFFTRAYDFGFSKSPEETLKKWNKEKILSDVVWVIRKFCPDIIITRFPITGEGGHGHHTASAILANEAFTAAADPTRFPEQLKYVQAWQANRILWNTFSFGNVNTTSDSQFHINVGGYNSFWGKSYGEIAAQSRSQHKSQGFGSTPSRGDSYDFFLTTGGTAPIKDLMDGVDVSWKKFGAKGVAIDNQISSIEKNFDDSAPQNSVKALTQVYKAINSIDSGMVWINKKKEEVQQLILQCAGFYIDAFSSQPYAVQTSKIDIELVINNRLGVPAALKNIWIDTTDVQANVELKKNRNYTFSKTFFVPLTKDITQPYWLKEKMEDNCYTINDQQLIGLPDVEPAYVAKFLLNIDGVDFIVSKPVQYRFTDPVMGEIFQPLSVVPPATITANQQLVIFNGEQSSTQHLQTQLHANTLLSGDITAGITGVDYTGEQRCEIDLKARQSKTYNFEIYDKHKPTEVYSISPYANKKTATDTTGYYLALRTIQYDHIPTIRFFYPDFVSALNINLKTAGKKIGYIPGAGDKVSPVLERMGYQVTILDKATLSTSNLSTYDAIITGVRAYNTNEWMNDFYSKLMSYVEGGGNLIVQYNTNNNLSVLNSKIGPYDFTITRNRITDENAKVNFLDPTNKVFNFPNKITEADFKNWIQERSIYHAANWSKEFKPLLSMADPEEKSDEGSLITCKYGKGYFTYTGLVFYRELPAAIPGAIRLMANLIAQNQNTINQQ